MPIEKLLLYILLAIVGIRVGFALVRFVWRMISEYRIRNKNELPRVRVHRHAIWQDPGDVSRLDFGTGPGGPDGAPAPPFRFLEEHTTGSSPNVSVQDAKGRRWRVKWGDEVRAESFATRLAWASGYFVETAFFVPDGKIEGASDLQRASRCIDQNGRFCDARFELDEKGIVKRFEEHGWSWNDNPFVGTKELHGLKILVMLTSNWDNKDVRDVARGSNTAVFYHKLPDGRIEARYLIIDWGGSMGKWGDVVSRGKWDSKGFLDQTPDFVGGVEEGIVKFGYTGQRTEDASGGISVDDVRWLNQYLGQISDSQLEDGLRASGATQEETSDFVRALRARIDQLKKVSEESKQEVV